MLRRIYCIAILISALLPFSISALGQEDSKQLPEGKGRDLVASVCTQCHGLEPTTGSRRTLEEWKNIVNDMVSNGAALDEGEVETVSQYLAKNFGPESDKSKESKEKH